MYHKTFRGCYNQQRQVLRYRIKKLFPQGKEKAIACNSTINNAPFANRQPILTTTFFFLPVYPSGGILEMSNGYPHSASPLGGSPSPGPSPGIGTHQHNHNNNNHNKSKHANVFPCVSLLFRHSNERLYIIKKILYTAITALSEPFDWCDFCKCVS